MVSHSPLNEPNSQSGDRYRRGWAALNRLVRERHSFSGRERNCFFFNTRGGRFATASGAVGFDFPDDARGLAVTDWDLDGKLDLWVSNRTAPRARFLHNRLPTEHHYLAVRLEGVTCNRDAIGARLELYLGKDGPTKRIKTLRAGESFASQSTKWIHFGLGEEDLINKLVVRWPGGQEEIFSDLQADRRYHLKQGSTAEEFPVTHRTLPKKLTNSETLVSSSESSTARVVCISRLPLPEANYEDFSGQKHPLDFLASPESDRPDSGAPVPRVLAINLWATWCPPCLQELQEWVKHHKQLQQAGIEVLALSVDGLGSDESVGEGRQQASQLVNKLKLPFRTGMATPKLLSHLDVLQRAMLDQQVNLPVPSTFLVTSGRGLEPRPSASRSSLHEQERRLHLLVLHKGRVSAEQLVADAKLAQASPATLRESTTSFQGRWITKPMGPSAEEVALKFLEQGNDQEAIAYLKFVLPQRSSRDRTAQERPAEGSSVEQTQVEADLRFLLARLYADGQQTAAAITAYHQTVEVDPGYRQAYLNLGAIYLEMGRLTQAERCFRKAVDLDPSDPHSLTTLGAVLVRARRPAEAIVLFRRAAALEPRHVLAHSNLARALHALGRMRDAVKQYRITLQLAPQQSSDANNLAWVLATSRERDVRDGAEAVEVAARLCRQTKHQDARTLATLAAAYAETGDFRQAVQTVRRAIDLTEASGQNNFTAFLRQHLARYQAQEPLRFP